MRWGSAVRVASWRSDIGLVPALQGLVTDRMGAVAAEQAETRTGVNGDILGSSVPDKGQKHGHRSQNVCRFLEEGGGGGGGQACLSPTLGIIWLLLGNM